MSCKTLVVAFLFVSSTGWAGAMSDLYTATNEAVEAYFRASSQDIVQITGHQLLMIQNQQAGDVGVLTDVEVGAAPGGRIYRCLTYFERREADAPFAVVGTDCHLK